MSVHQPKIERFSTSLIAVYLLAQIAVCVVAILASPEWVASKLTVGDGESARLIALALPGWGGRCLVATICVGILLLLGWNRRQRVIKNIQSERFSSLRSFVVSPIGLLAATAGLALLLDSDALLDGHFESDDFALLTTDRVTPWNELPVARVNDNIYPVGRYLLRLVLWCFGPNPVAFNGICFASNVALLFAGGRLTQVLSRSVLSGFVFVAIAIPWTLWGEFISGQYILQFHLTIMTAAFVSLLSWLGYRERGGTRDLVVFAAALFYAAFSNMAGLWVVGSCTLFLAAETLSCYFSFPQTQASSILRSRNRFGWAILCVVSLLSLIFYSWAYTRSRGPDFLSSAGPQITWMGHAEQMAAIGGSSVLSVFIPIPHHLADFGMLKICVWMVLAAWLALSVRMLYVEKELRFRLQYLAIVGSFAGVCAMITLGRPNEPWTQVVPPKYMFMPFLWFCIACCVIGTSLARRGSSQMIATFVACSLLAIWTSHLSASYFGTQHVPFFATTRGGKLEEHRAEYRCFEILREDLFRPLMETSGEDPVILRDVSGSLLLQEFPSLAFPWGECPSLSYFIDVLVPDPQKIRFIDQHTEDLTVDGSYPNEKQKKILQATRIGRLACPQCDDGPPQQ